MSSLSPDERAAAVAAVLPAEPAIQATAQALLPACPALQQPAHCDVTVQLTGGGGTAVQLADGTVLAAGRAVLSTSRAVLPALQPMLPHCQQAITTWTERSVYRMYTVEPVILGQNH